MRYRLVRCALAQANEMAVKNVLEAIHPVLGKAWEFFDGLRKKYAAAVRLEEQKADLEQIAAATPEQVVAEVRSELQQHFGSQPALKREMEVFVSRFPGQVRQSMRHPADPSGRVAPPGHSLSNTLEVSRAVPKPSVFSGGEEVPNLPGWFLRDYLGGGGFGEVWLVEDRRGGQPPRAAKFCTDPASREELIRREARVITRIQEKGSHPGIVAVLGSSIVGEHPWVMYEFVAGGDLESLGKSWVPLGPAERVARSVIALHALAEAVAHVHRLSPPIVHRDLKPANVLVEPATGRLRITDFGIGGVVARAMGQTIRLSTTTRSLNPLLGAATALYASPEQLAGEPADPRDDIHAMGVIVYQLLVNRYAVAPAARYERELRAAGVPDGLIALVGDCVDADQANRPADGAALAARLAQFLPEDHSLRRLVNSNVRAIADFKEVEKGAYFGKIDVNVGGFVNPEASSLYDRAHALWASSDPSDRNEARRLFVQAADLGDPQSAVNAGAMFYSGQGGAADFAAAYRYFLQAAKAGIPAAFVNLGTLYRNGKGVDPPTPSFPQALHWFRKAWEAGVAEGAFAIGTLFETRPSFVWTHEWPVDLVQAREWYQRAADAGVTAARQKLGALASVQVAAVPPAPEPLNDWSPAVPDQYDWGGFPESPDGSYGGYGGPEPVAPDEADPANGGGGYGGYGGEELAIPDDALPEDGGYAGDGGYGGGGYGAEPPADVPPGDGFETESW